jgi:hypothetical protein
MTGELQKYRQQWLEEHKNANWIVVNPETGEPIKAVYDRIDGKPRQYVAEYPFPPEWWTESHA